MTDKYYKIKEEDIKLVQQYLLSRPIGEATPVYQAACRIDPIGLEPTPLEETTEKDKKKEEKKG